MPDAARVAQAQALEVPVILQGAKTADESGKRELFTENATTTLVFENGAVLNLRSKLTVGQAIFIHNKQNGREILCKVIEAPAEGEAGYTDLEFTTVDPEFWHANGQTPDESTRNSQAAADKPATNQQVEAPAENTLAMMSETASKIELSSLNTPEKDTGGPLREELVPAHMMVPEPGAAAPVTFANAEPSEPTQSTEPTGDQIDAALKQMSAANQAPSPEGADATSQAAGGEDEKHLAALMARDARLAKHAAIKEQQIEKIQKDAAAKDAPEAAATAEAASGQEIVIPKVPWIHTLTPQKRALITQIVACVAMAVALGFVWHAMRGIFFHPSLAPMAAPVASNPKPPAPAPARPATAAKPTRIETRTPPAKVAAGSATIPAASSSAPVAKVDNSSPAAETARSSGNRDVTIADGVSEPPKREKATEPSFAGTVPARITSQPQPTFPAWAKSLDLDGVVTLDAVIDEKGNVKVAKVLSGPRPLQRAAEQAVGLWEFEPARSAGKPIASHMTLTVEFKR